MKSMLCLCRSTPSTAHPTCWGHISVHIWKNSEQLTMTRAVAVCMSVGVKGGIYRLNTNNMAGLSGRRSIQGLPGSTLLFINHNIPVRNGQIMWYMMTCVSIGMSDISLFPQNMFSWDCGSWHSCGSFTKHQTKHNYGTSANTVNSQQ